MRAQEFTDLSPFRTDTTDLPFYDDMMKNPEYFARKKGLEYEIVWMSPAKYIKLAAAGFETTIEQLYKTRDTRHVEKMQNGVKFPMPILSYRDVFGQEGLHRAMAAEKIGISKIPVMIVTQTD